MNIDELMEAMERDEREDRLAEQTTVSVSDYARARGVRPQLVHYHIRTGHIRKVRCACGRWVINIAEADAVMVRGRAAEVQTEEKVSGSDMDSGESER